MEPEDEWTEKSKMIFDMGANSIDIKFDLKDLAMPFVDLLYTEIMKTVPMASFDFASKVLETAIPLFDMDRDPDRKVFEAFGQKITYRVIMDFLATPEFIDLGCDIVRNKDKTGELIQRGGKWDDSGWPALYCRVKCPTTGKEFELRTDPEVKTCREGLAVLAGLTEEEYIFAMET